MSPEGQPFWRPFEDVAESEYVYRASRDKLVHMLALAGWADGADGHQLAPTGQFWRMSNDSWRAAKAYAYYAGLFNELAVSPVQAVGQFIVKENLAHEVEVLTFERRGRMLVEYAVMQEMYRGWLAA